MPPTLNQTLAIEVQRQVDAICPGGAPLEESITLTNLSRNQAVRIEQLEIKANDNRSEPLEKWQRLSETLPLELLPGQERNVSLFLEVPTAVDAGFYSYNIVLHSDWPGDGRLHQPRQLRVLPPVELPDSHSEPDFEVTPPTRSDQPYRLRTETAFPVTIQIKNRSRLVDRFFLRCPDLSESWFTIEFPEAAPDQPGRLTRTDGLQLNPGDAGEIVLRLHPPRTTPAGVYSSTLQLKSHNQEKLLLLNILYFEILVDKNLTVELTPDTRTLPSPQETFDLRVTNAGNVVREVAIAAEDSADLFNYTIAPDVVALQPGETAEIELTPWPKRGWRRSWRGAQEVAFTVSLFDLQAENEWVDPLPMVTGTLVWQSRSPWLKWLLWLLVGLLALAGALGLAYWLLAELVVKPSQEPRIREFSSTQTTYSATDNNPIRLNWSIQNPEQVEELVVTYLAETGESLVQQGFPQSSLAQRESCTLSTYRPHAMVRLLRRLYRQNAELNQLSCLGVALQPPGGPGTLPPGYYQAQLELFRASSAPGNTPPPQEGEAAEQTSPDANSQAAEEQLFPPATTAWATDTKRIGPIQLLPADPPTIIALAAQAQTYRWNPPGVTGEETDPYPGLPIRLNWSIQNPEMVAAVELSYDQTNYSGQVSSSRLSYPMGNGLPQGLEGACRGEGSQLLCSAVPLPVEAPGHVAVTLTLITVDAQRITQTLDPIEVQPPLPQILAFTLNQEDVQAVPHHFFELDPDQEPVTLTLAWTIASPEWMRVKLLPAPGQLSGDRTSLTHTLAPLSGALSFTLVVTNPLGEQVSRSVQVETTVPIPEPEPTVIVVPSPELAPAPDPLSPAPIPLPVPLLPGQLVPELEEEGQLPESG